jgi:hypothetical protein
MSTSGIDSSKVSGQLDARTLTLESSSLDIQQLLPQNTNQDAVNVNVNDLYKSLTLFAQQVLDKLRETLGDQLPDGLNSFQPEDHTPEKTAQRIVDGSTALFPIFAKQHSDLQGEELITEFMKTIRGGIQKGYSDAESVLGDIGAFDIDGVKNGIEKTKELVEQGLQSFEQNYRQQQGLTTTDDSGTTAATDSVEVKTTVSSVA